MLFASATRRNVLGMMVLVLMAQAWSCRSRKPPRCEDQPSVEGRQACYDRENALISRERCATLVDPGRLAACLTELVPPGDVAGCQEVDAISPSPKCFSSAAEHLEKAEICDHIAAFQDRVECVKAVAFKTQNADPCEHIQAPLERETCIAAVALKAKDVLICDRIKNPTRRDRCRKGDKSYFNGAACERMEGARRKEECYLAQANWFYKERTIFDIPPEACDKAGRLKTRCLSDLARKGRPELCERVGSRPDSPARKLCYDNAFAEARESCAGIPDRAATQACEARIAARIKNSAVCSTLVNGEDADDCWNSVAKTDGALCLRIAHPDLKTRCLRENWAKAKDGGICPSLAPPALVRACAARFALKSLR